MENPITRALTGLMFAGQAAAMGTAPDFSLNAWEVLILPKADHVEFAVVTSRERRRNPEAVNAGPHRVRSVEAMIVRLEELDPGAWIFFQYYDARLDSAMSELLRERLKAACRSQNRRCAFAF